MGPSWESRDVSEWPPTEESPNVTEKEPEVKKKSIYLLKEVLHKFEGEDPVSALIQHSVADIEKDAEKAVSVFGTKKKNVASTHQQHSCEEMTSSLLDTWNIINGKVSEFKPSKQLTDVLTQLVKPEVQQGIQDMLKYFGAKESKVYENLQPITESHLGDQPDTDHQYAQQTNTCTQMPDQNFSAYPKYSYYNANFSRPQSDFMQDFQYTSEFTEGITQPYTQHFLEIPSTHFSPQSNSDMPNTLGFDKQPLATNNQLPLPSVATTYSSNTDTTRSNIAVECTFESSAPTSEIQELRRSPRKAVKSGGTPAREGSASKQLVSPVNEDLTLMNGVTIPRHKLRAATQAAVRNSKPGFTLMAKLVSGVFTTKELAFSRGLGIGKTKAGDLREPLDSSKITACKEYVNGWLKRKDLPTSSKSQLNDAITEQCSYARKKLK